MTGETLQGVTLHSLLSPASRGVLQGLVTRFSLSLSPSLPLSLSSSLYGSHLRVFRGAGGAPFAARFDARHPDRRGPAVHSED